MVNEQNPYVIPDDELYYIINFSGGRSSGLLLHNILDANQGIPDNAEVIFTNTGKEHPATLDFIRECEKQWGVGITWLEYARDDSAKGIRGDPKNIYRIVTYENASRKGEPFEQLIRGRIYLPNVTQRICTAELKVGTIHRYLSSRGFGPKDYRNILGIRYDERRRWEKAIFTECRVDYPLVHDKVTKEDVLDFWNNSPFDLQISHMYGNCDLCFLKGKDKLLAIIQEDPSLMEWWSNQEEYVKKYRHVKDYPKNAQFSKRYSYKDLLAESKIHSMQGDLFEQPHIDCFCGD